MTETTGFQPYCTLQLPEKKFFLNPKIYYQRAEFYQPTVGSVVGLFKVPGDSNVQPEVMNACLGPFKSAGSSNLPRKPETRRGGRMQGPAGLARLP